ncbi:MAG: Fic family protein [Cycloclasticus sp.]
MNDGKYIWQHADWPRWHYDVDSLSGLLADVHYAQGHLVGRMHNVGLSLRNQAALQVLTEEVIKTSEIEGDHLNHETVRSSVARRLGLDVGALAPVDRHVDGMVDMVLDATANFDQQLTEARLFGWHAALFPTGYSGMTRINVGGWRDDKLGPMQVISGPIGREKVHYEAPPANEIAAYVSAFLSWFNGSDNLDPLIKAGLAHLWFVSIHPFDDGNGRISRAVADVALARAEQSKQRFYSLSAQIQRDRKDYYDRLEWAQKNALDVTGWLEWFLGCLLRAIQGANVTLSVVLTKAQYWQHWADIPMNERQIKLLNSLLDGFEGKLNSSKWGRIAKCSPDTALRDITGLLNHGVLLKSGAGGRSTSYELAPI